MGLEGHSMAQLGPPGRTHRARNPFHGSSSLDHGPPSAYPGPQSGTVPGT